MVQFTFENTNSFISSPTTLKQLKENLIEELEIKLGDDEELIIFNALDNQILKTEEDYTKIREKSNKMEIKCELINKKEREREEGNLKEKKKKRK